MNLSRNRSLTALAILGAFLVLISLIQLIGSNREPSVGTSDQQMDSNSDGQIDQAELPGTSSTASHQSLDLNTSAVDPSDEPSMPDENAEHQWVDGIESLIYDYLAQRTDYEFTSITSVDCSEHECEIVFTGANANPKNIGDFKNLNSQMFLPPISAATATFFTREIVAGAREYVIRISNIPWKGRNEEQQEED